MQSWDLKPELSFSPTPFCLKSPLPALKLCPVSQGEGCGFPVASGPGVADPPRSAERRKRTRACLWLAAEPCSWELVGDGVLMLRAMGRGYQGNGGREADGPRSPWAKQSACAPGVGQTQIEGTFLEGSRWTLNASHPPDEGLKPPVLGPESYVPLGKLFNFSLPLSLHLWVGHRKDEVVKNSGAVDEYHLGACAMSPAPAVHGPSESKSLGVRHGG